MPDPPRKGPIECIFISLDDILSGRPIPRSRPGWLELTDKGESPPRTLTLSLSPEELIRIRDFVYVLLADREKRHRRPSEPGGPPSPRTR